MTLPTILMLAGLGLVVFVALLAWKALWFLRKAKEKPTDKVDNSE